MQLVWYLGTMAAILLLLKRERRHNAPSRPAQPAVAVVMTLASGALLFAPSPARAEFKVWSPYVEEGVLEFELKERHDFDDDRAGDHFQQHKLEIKYGVSSWLALAVEGEVEREAGEGSDYEATEFEAYLQFTDPGEYWLDAGGKLVYEITHDAGKADKVEGALFLQKGIGRWTHRLNLTLEKEVGHKPDGLEFEAAWRTGYLIAPAFEPGIEWYSGFGEIEHTGNWSAQEHLAGPVAHGKLGGGFKYEAGYLFGLSRGAPDGSAKLILEYEIPL